MEVPLSSLLVSSLVLVMLSMSAPTNGAFLKKDASRMKNSPIFYIAAPSLFGAGRPNLMNSFSTQSLLLNALHSLPAQRPSNFAISQLYRLPIRYLSNAKPIDIISAKPSTGIKKIISAQSSSGFSKKRRKPMSPGTASKIFNLPLKYQSNGKPGKVFINSIGKH